MEATQETNFETQADFPVGVQQLYTAWTTEEDLKKWWKPNGNTLKSLTNDIKDGGEVKYEFADEEGQTLFIISGTYEEAKPAEKLVYTWNWDVTNEPIKNAEYKLTVTFSGDDSSSHIDVKQEGFKDEETVVPHKEGWDLGLQALKAYLSGKE